MSHLLILWLLSSTLILATQAKHIKDTQPRFQKGSELALTCRGGNRLVQSDTGVLGRAEPQSGEHKGDLRPQGVSHFN